MNDQTYQVGDKLLIYGGGYYHPDTIETVVSVTPAGNAKTDKGNIINKSGDMRGNSSTWDRRHAKKATPEQVVEVNNKNRKTFIVNAFNERSLRLLSLEILEKMYDLAKPTLEPEKP
jgi:hypothetical protein